MIHSRNKTIGIGHGGAVALLLFVYFFVSPSVNTAPIAQIEKTGEVVATLVAPPVSPKKTHISSPTPGVDSKRALPDTQTACPLITKAAALATSGKFDNACAAAYVAQLCAQKDSDLTGKLATYLGTHPLNVDKGLGRYNILNQQSLISWCDLPTPGLLQALAIARTAKKAMDTVKAAANRDYLIYTMSDTNGSIDAGGYSAAIEQRRLMLQGNQITAGTALDQSSTGSSAIAVGPRPSRLAAQSTTLAGWTNLTGYLHPVGRINDLLIDSGGTTNARTMWAGADGGGIWKTTNGGASWAPVNDFNGSLAIGKILRSPRNALEMYASTNPYGSHTYSPFGVLKSNDGGVTWAQLAATNPATNPDWEYVTHLAIHPSGAAGQDVLLAATKGGNGGGVFQSTDSGTTWTKVSANAFATYVGFHPADGNRRAYALNDGNITMTANGTWADATTTTVLAGTTAAYTKFSFAPSNFNIMYALASDVGGATHLLRSDTGGANWAALTAPANFFYNNSLLYYTGGLWVDPTNANRMAVFEGWAATTPNATNATASAGWAKSPIGWTDFHGAVADPEFNGTSNKIIYLMDDGGLYRFDDADTLTNGTFLATGMTVTEAYSVAGRGGNIIFGAQDVGPRVYRGQYPIDVSARWGFVANPAQCNGCAWIGDGASTAAARDNNSVIYGSRQYLDLFRSDDGGMNGVSLCGTVPTNITEGRCGANYSAAFIAPFMLDPNNSNIMLAGAASAANCM